MVYRICIALRVAYRRQTVSCRDYVDVFWAEFYFRVYGEINLIFFRQKMPLYILLGYQEKIHIVEFMRHQFLSCTERFPGLVFLNSRKQREFIKFNVYVVLLKLVTG